MPAKHALLIGNSTFRHTTLARLSAPANDVRALATLLEDPLVGGFGVELKLDVGLVDARRLIKGLFEDRHPDDLLLFYYSGHGLLDAQGQFYLAMTETDPSDPDPGSIDETWLRGVFDRSLSNRQIAILDCCHSGSFIPGGLTPRDGAVVPVLTEKTFDPAGQGRFIMAATTANASAFEQEGRSLYTRHIVEGLTNGAAAPARDFVTVLDLHEFIKRRVAETALAPMRPQLWRDASLNPGAEHLAIARNPSPRPKLPDEEIGRLWSDNLEAMELGIFRLMEIAKSNRDLSVDAQKVLGERLNAADTIPYTLGVRIAEFLDLDAARQPKRESDDLVGGADENIGEIQLESRALREELKVSQQKRDALADALASEKENLSRIERAAAEETRKQEENIIWLKKLRDDALDRARASEEELKYLKGNCESISASLLEFKEKTEYLDEQLKKCKDARSRNIIAAVINVIIISPFFFIIVAIMIAALP